MIFIKITPVDVEKARVNYMHYMPFDPIDGLGKTEEQLLLEGLLVDSIPEPDIINDKVGEMFYNIPDGKLYYEYIDTPTTPPTPEEKIAQLEAELAQAKAEVRIANQRTAENTQNFNDFVEFYIMMNPDQV